MTIQNGKTNFTKTELKKLLKFRQFFSDKIWEEIISEGQETTEMGEFFGDLYDKLENIFNYIPDTEEYEEMFDEVEEEVEGW